MEKVSSEWKSAIEELATKGLNIFASGKISEFPPDVIDLLAKTGVAFDKEQSIGVLGHGGKTLWTQIPKPVVSKFNPIDNFSIRHVHWLNQQLLHDSKLEILYPSERWTIPLQRIGRHLNISRASPLGLDIHREYGLWFAFRAVFLTSASLPEVRGESFTAPCDSCQEKQCRSACPSGAVGGSSAEFKLSTCADFRLQETSPCVDRCLARIACPYQEQHRYTLEQIRYHMLRPEHLKRLSTYKS